MGNTYGPFDYNDLQTVHPHACGEHFALSSGSVPASGSSPRLWGTPKSIKGRHVQARFIPTPVGNTAGACVCTVYSTVHPHACGEHCSEALPARVSTGSSPRLWGTHYMKLRLKKRTRFIPTPVGNTAE
ncbi:hypothetical protein D1AOALGA4SA_11486 [Olavius algarvensis Delta 1 endosymbiont]|nr:hypothetical protein D1AOALGA4SA_11486 [Olavius algarvensis Delta 1 endosymbiont]